ncbi:hypothetical protein CYMTET_13197 [Cymbomonas tetramitiformis]|uniref:EGF-like domain-containing protein n=1 Tax=Cymbomonas tetramitiformis TaxID=36881 RepID=A0AAE0LBF4_9CHLO|nr:hypothetical protein CYMTET_13197 [Cymbomonas tetramitiformis]
MLTDEPGSIFTSPEFDSYGTVVASGVTTTEATLAYFPPPPSSHPPVTPPPSPSPTIALTSSPTIRPHSEYPTMFNQTTIPTPAGSSSAPTSPIPGYLSTSPTANPIGCPTGYSGNGTACTDIDGCSSDPCFEGVECADVAAPGVGYVCSDCPTGYSGNGTACTDIDGCSSDPCFEGVECADVAAPGVGYVCSDCPTGYSGNGTACTDIDGCSSDPCFEGVECADVAAPGVGYVCSDCPTGYSGNGTACTDIDGCSSDPCFEGVECADVAAPGVGYVCSDCPTGYSGNGISCEVDQCAKDNGGCDPMVTCMTASGGGVVCGACPQGYGDDSTNCVDADECSVNNGDCDLRTNCTNTEGGYECGECPAGYLGSGATGCILSTSCEEDNGGCHDTVTCTQGDDGDVACGECPDGYTGTGATGCVDEDGCAELECYAGVHCEDVRAPGTGAACGDCPAGLIGDGLLCYEDPCWSSNGGCDLQVSCTAEADAPMGRLCGSCPAGYSDMYGDGTVCEDTNACNPNGCHPGVTCADRKAPDEGFDCGECPEGFTGDGVNCADVDECASDAAACDPLTACSNVEGGYECTPCPDGYRGSGLAGCTLSSDCTTDNGGCDALTTCTQEGATPVCGSCPTGYSGTGDTGCFDTDGCVDSPCFVDTYGSAALCSDVPAPGSGHTCGACPEGYRGDGTTCEVCDMVVQIIDSSTVDGVALSSQEVQIVGQVGALQEGCTNTAGRTFRWAASSSSGANLELTQETHRSSTLTLRLPRGTLEAQESYTIGLEAAMAAASHVKSTAQLAFYVDEEPLQALIRGGGASLGEDSLVILDAGASDDPAGNPAAFSFDWQCQRLTGDPCRQRDGTLLPSTLTNTTLQLYLQGDEAGRVHTFKLTARKGARSSVVYTNVTVVWGAPPVPSIAPLSGKADPTMKLTLTSTLASSATSVEEVHLWWTMWPVAGTGTADVDLDSSEVLASASRAGTTLVLQAGALQQGGRYVFQLQAEQAGSTGSTNVEVQMNSPPAGGRLEVSPEEGTSLQTVFSLNTSGWDEEDLPLAASFSYRVVGSNSSKFITLNSVSPSQAVEMTLPEGGIEQGEYLVEVAVRVMDRHGSSAELVTHNVTVYSPTFSSEDDRLEYVASVTGDSEALLANGQAADAVNSVTGAATLLVDDPSTDGADDSPQRRRRQSKPRASSSAALQTEEAAAGEDARSESNSTLQRRGQRESLMAVTAAAHSELTPSSTVQEWVAGVALTLVDCPPEESSQEMRQQVLELYRGLLDVSMMPDGVPMTVTLAQSILDGLSTVAAGVEADGAAGESYEVLRGLSGALLRQMSAGERPARLSSDHAQLLVQRDSLAEWGGTAERLLDTVITAPGEDPESAILLPTRLQEALQRQAGEEVDLRFLVMGSDPHLNRSTPAALQTHRACSSLTSASLLHRNGTELAVEALSEPVELNLTVAGLAGVLEASSLANLSAGGDMEPMRCAFWEAASEQYSSDGCASLPNPAPPNATLFWREDLWSSLGATSNGSTSASLEMSAWWGMDHPWLLEGCNESTPSNDASSADGEEARYTGAACELLSPTNAAQCYWDEARAGFMGAGCEAAPLLQCRCNHLTDFLVNMPVVAFAPPPPPPPPPPLPFPPPPLQPPPPPLPLPPPNQPEIAGTPLTTPAPPPAAPLSSTSPLTLPPLPPPPPGASPRGNATATAPPPATVSPTQSVTNTTEELLLEEDDDQPADANIFSTYAVYLCLGAGAVILFLAGYVSYITRCTAAKQPPSLDGAKEAEETLKGGEDLTEPSTSSRAPAGDAPRKAVENIAAMTGVPAGSTIDERPGRPDDSLHNCEAFLEPSSVGLAAARGSECGAGHQQGYVGSWLMGDSAPLPEIGGLEAEQGESTWEGDEVRWTTLADLAPQESVNGKKVQPAGGGRWSVSSNPVYEIPQLSEDRWKFSNNLHDIRAPLPPPDRSPPSLTSSAHEEGPQFGGESDSETETIESVPRQKGRLPSTNEMLALGLGLSEPGRPVYFTFAQDVEEALPRPHATDPVPSPPVAVQQRTGPDLHATGHLLPPRSVKEQTGPLPAFLSAQEQTSPHALPSPLFDQERAGQPWSIDDEDMPCDAVGELRRFCSQPVKDVADMLSVMAKHQTVEGMSAADATREPHLSLMTEPLPKDLISSRFKSHTAALVRHPSSASLGGSERVFHLPLPREAEISPAALHSPTGAQVGGPTLTQLALLKNEMEDEEDRQQQATVWSALFHELEGKQIFSADSDRTQDGASSGSGYATSSTSMDDVCIVVESHREEECVRRRALRALARQKPPAKMVHTRDNPLFKGDVGSPNAECSSKALSLHEEAPKREMSQAWRAAVNSMLREQADARVWRSNPISNRLNHLLDPDE